MFISRTSETQVKLRPASFSDAAGSLRAVPRGPEGAPGGSHFALLALYLSASWGAKLPLGQSLARESASRGLGGATGTSKNGRSKCGQSQVWQLEAMLGLQVDQM